MSAFLLLLVKLNLAMGMAIILVALLRRPLRAWFGAPIAYAIWFLVPIAGIASLLPPRVAALAPVTPVHVPAASLSAMDHVAPSALRATEQLTNQWTNQWAGQGTSPAIPALSPASAHAMPAIVLLFAAWALGALFMAFYLTLLQVRFSAAMRRGEAGPAVLGFLRPRIVTPASFREHFTPREQAAILAHERIHLARQDARINAAAALLRCLCWFNPLIHLGARWLRIDQELACDATAVAGAISRRDYAEALLKTQLVVTALPLGCNWPGSQHPLIERIALLKRKPLGAARRLAGVGLVLLAATSAGLGAWAAQPPVTATPPGSHPSIAMTTLAAPVAAPGQTTESTVLRGKVATENPTGRGNEVGPSKNVLANRTVSAALANSEMPPTAGIVARAGSSNDMQSQTLPPPPANISGLPPIDTLATPAVLAANSPPERTRNDRLFARTSQGVVRSRTEPALACLLGFAPKRCENMFSVTWTHGGPCFPSENTHFCINRITTYCGKDYADEPLCPYGALEAVDYLGTNGAGADVYEVQYKHTHSIYVIAPPGADGRVRQFWVKRGTVNGIIPFSLVHVTSETGASVYRRSWDGSPGSKNSL